MNVETSPAFFETQSHHLNALPYNLDNNSFNLDDLPDKLDAFADNIDNNSINIDTLPN